MSSPGQPTVDLGLRRATVAACRDLVRRGLTHGTSGNLSVRRNELSYFVSPRGIDYQSLEADDIPWMRFDGCWFGRRRPSSEWRFHHDILKARSDACAVVHTHSLYSAAVAGGADVRCAPYHTCSSQELSDAAVAAMDGRKACLLANHGVIALVADLAAALALAGEVETLAAQYCSALAAGGVQILDEAEMQRVVENFRTYGERDAVDAGLVRVGVNSDRL
jgi:L-fuculose-phosphate aldolase